MKHSLIIILLTILMALQGCSDDIGPEAPSVPLPDGTPADIIIGMTFPELDLGAGTRAMGDEPTAAELLNTLKVNLFVFDPSGVMLQFIGPEDINIQAIDEVSKHVYFKVKNIYSSSRPRRLHFVISPLDDLHAIPGGEYITAMASETTTLPALIVEGDTDAYWGIKEVPEITEEMELKVKLIRNFVKLSVTSSEDPSVFRMLGYTVVNRPGSGTVAPYIYKDHLFASFLNNENGLLDYDQIIGQGYFGVNPAGSDRNMTYVTEEDVARGISDSQARFDAGAADTPVYIYERSQSGLAAAGSEVKVTYIIIYAIYRGTPCYYKIDIGRDKEGKFGFYDLLRNFRYTVDITEVGGAGAPTLREAMNGAAHNNLSTSVETRDLFSIGYHGEKIEVSSTRVIFTERTAGYSLRFRYTTPSGTTFDPSRLKIYDLADESKEFDLSGVTATREKKIDLRGEVITDATLIADSDGWYRLNVSTRDIPSDSRRYEQNIRIYYNGGNTGLGRTVTFMLRRPWEFSGLTAGTPGQGMKSSFSLGFTLPSGLSKSQFPLIITFESDKQNIYAANGSNLTVATGKSAFKGSTTDAVISYEWRFEWEDYSPDGGEGGGRYTAEFLTNTTSADDRSYDTSSIDAAESGNGRTSNNGSAGFCIRIANKEHKYFNPAFVNVRRD